MAGNNIKGLEEAGIKKGARVLVRVDINEPVENGELSDDFRIEKTMPTLFFLKERGARTVIISHHSNAKQSLRPAFSRLQRKLPISFYDEGFDFNEKHQPAEGEFLMLENLRFDDGEEKNDPAFAGKLAKWGDIYVNEAFSASHRTHASVVGVIGFLPAFAGLRFKMEIENLSMAFNPNRPSVVVLGGAKSETKIPVISGLSDKTDRFLIGGATANDFLSADGREIGQSLVSPKGVVMAGGVLSRMREKIVLPEDVITAEGENKMVKNVGPGDVVLDVGRNFLKTAEKVLRGAKFIIWNGSLGNTEKGFDAGTKKIAEIILSTEAFAIVGGGDTLSALKQIGLREKFPFLSLGGGAMLKFLAEGTLPGIEALKK